MQKKLIALAIAGLASTAAFAQSNVTVYGRVDMGFASRSDDLPRTNLPAATRSGNKTEMVQGMGAGSRFGFKGAEDLGNGMKAIFELEYGLTPDQGVGLTANQIWNRHSWVGLTGDFGTVVAGRVDGARYNVMIKYDPMGGYGVGALSGAGMNQGYITRGDNGTVYISPTFGGGFSFIGGYVTNLLGAEGVNTSGVTCNPTSSPNCGDLRDGILQLNYNNGPIGLTVNYERVSIRDSVAIKTYQLGGSYDFGAAKVLGVYDNIKNDPGTTDSRDWVLGVQVPFAGKAKFKIGYAEHDDKTAANQDCKKWGVGLTYDMSKRTQIYTDYGKVTNKTAGNGCGLTTSAATGSADLGGAAFGTKGVDVGLAHNF